MASEIDKYANQAYEILYGEPTVGDVTKIDAENVPDHDLLVGGFPCQAFSVAGKQLGFDDTRGTLFFEIARIAKVKRPKAMLLENVKGLISHDKGKTLDTIIQTLGDIGYTVDFNVLNSKYFGVPQNRERIFIIAVRDDLIKTESWRIEGTNVVAKGKRRISEIDGVKTFNFDWPTQDSVTTRLRDILEDNVDERFYLSEEKTAKLVAQLENDVITAVVDVHEKDGEQVGTKETGEPRMVGHVDIKGHDAVKRVYDPEHVSPTLTTMGGGHREPKIAVNMNRHEINKETDISHCLMARDYKGFGNQDMTGVLEEIRPVLTPDRAEKSQNGRRFKEDGEESFTLTAQDKHGVAIGQLPRYRIRKLTPRECFRLQSFADSEFDKLTANGISNSQLYKMAGNAVTVNVIDATGRRLLPLLGL
jgi:DNA (cytosine-5)-methyltransferase 1